MSSPNQPIPNGSTGFTLPPARLQIPGQSGGPGTGLLGDLFAQFFNNLLTAGTGISIAVVDGVIQISTSGGGGATLQSATVTLTSAQLLELGEHYVEIVPPVAGAIIVPISAVLNYVFGTTPYSNTLGYEFLFQWGNTADQGGIEVFQFGGQGFVDQSSNQVGAVCPSINNGGSPTAESSGGIFITGPEGSDLEDGDGTLTVTIFYVTQTVS